jgi:hypothetical protein
MKESIKASNKNYNNYKYRSITNYNTGTEMDIGTETSPATKFVSLV